MILHLSGAKVREALFVDILRFEQNGWHFADAMFKFYQFDFGYIEICS